MASKEKKIAKHEKGESELVRRFKANPFIFIGSFVILIIVIIAFVMPSSMGLGGRNVPDFTFGYYDKVPISYVPGNYFANYYEMVARYYQNNMNADNYYYMNRQIWNESFEAAVVHAAVLQETKRAGFTVPPKVVDKEVVKHPQFQVNGVFSPALYGQLDRNVQLSIWEDTRDNIARNHFQSDIGGLLAPSTEGEFIGRMASVQRSFQMAVFPVDRYPNEEYEAYALENSDIFRSVHLSMITVSSSEREAKKILESIKKEEITFEEAARAYSKDSYVDRGGDMGIRMIYDLSWDIPEELVREKVIALAKGGYSDVMKTSLGWAFFRAEEDIVEPDTADPALIDKVRYYVRNYERGRMEDWAVGQAEDFVTMADALGFEEAVSARGIESRSFGPVPINYGSVDLFPALSSQSISEINNSASNYFFWDTAFSTPVGAMSRPLVQGGNVLVFVPTEETRADESVVEGITSTFSDYWLSYMTEQSLRQFFIESPKMVNNFFDVYNRYFSDQGF